MNLNEKDRIGGKDGKFFHDFKKNKIRVIVVGVIFIFVVILFLYYIFVGSKNVFKLAIDRGIHYLENSMTNSESVSGTFSVKGDGNHIEKTTNTLEMLSKVDLQGIYGVDYKKEIMNLSLNSKYNYNKLVDADVYIEEGNGYIFLRDIYDKYIKLSGDYENLFTNMDKRDDYKVLLSRVSITLNDSLKDDYFISSKEKINGKTLKKTTLELNRNNYLAIRKDFCNELAQDKKFLDSYSHVTGKSSNDIKTELNKVKDNDKEFKDVNISIYTTIWTSKFVKLEIEEANDKFIITENHKQYNFEFIRSKKLIYDGEILISGDKNNLTCDIKVHDKEKKNSLNLVVNNSIKYGEKIDKKDISNSISSDDIATVEMFEIYFNLSKEEGFKDLSKDLSKLSK